MKKIKWITGIVIVILIVICIVYSAMQGIPVHAGKVTKGTIKEYVEERAVTTLPDTFKISMPISGRIKPITLVPGTSIKKGQLVAQVDESDTMTLVTECSARVDAIKGEIKINEYHAFEETALKESEDWIKTMENLTLFSEQKVLANKNVYKFANEYSKTLAASGQAISRISDYKAKIDAAVAEVDVESASIIHNAVNLLTEIFRLAPTYINEFIFVKKLKKEILQSQLAETEASLAEARRNLQRCKINSPIDGIVLHRYISNERFLDIGTLLLELGNLDDLQVTADILSEEAVNIAPGNIVDVFGPAIGDIPVHGKVIRVDPKGFTKLSSLGVEQQRVQVKIAFDKDSLDSLKKAKKFLGDSFRLQVKVYTASKNNALIVPRTALFKGNDGNWKVYLIKNYKAEIKDITIGLINDSEAEVLTGLSDEDEVILAPSNTLANGTRVSYN